MAFNGAGGDIVGTVRLEGLEQVNSGFLKLYDSATNAGRKIEDSLIRSTNEFTSAAAVSTSTVGTLQAQMATLQNTVTGTGSQLNNLTASFHTAASGTSAMTGTLNSLATGGTTAVMTIYGLATAYDLVGKKGGPLIYSITGLVAALGLLSKASESNSVLLKTVAQAAVVFTALSAAVQIYNERAKIGKVLTLAFSASLAPIALLITGVTAAVFAFKNAMDARYGSQVKQTGATRDEINELDKLVERYNTLSAKETLSAEESNELKNVSFQIQQAFREQGKEIEITKDNVSGLTEEYKELRKIELQKEIDHLNKTIDGGNVAWNAWNNLLNFGARLANDEVKITMQTEERKQKLREQIMQNEKELGILNGTTKETIDINKELNDANIETEQSVRDQIDTYTSLIDNVKEGGHEYQQIIDKLTELYGKLGEVNPLLDEQAVLNQKLRDAGVTLTSDINNEIAKLWELAGSVQAGSSEYNQLIQKIYELSDANNVANPALQSMIDQFNAQGDAILGDKDKLESFKAAFLPSLQAMGVEVDTMKGKQDNYTAALEIALEVFKDVPEIHSQITAALEEHKSAMENLTEAEKKELKRKKELKAAGIKLTKEVKKQIDNLWKQAKAAGTTEYEFKQLVAQINNLSSASGEANPYLQDIIGELDGVSAATLKDVDALADLKQRALPVLKMAGIETSDFTETQNLLIEALEKQIPLYEDEPEKLEKIIEAVERLKNAKQGETGETEKSTESWGKNALLIGDISGKLGGFGEIVSQTTNFLATLATSGLGPVGILLSGISMILGMVDTSASSFDLTIDELRERLGEFGDELERINSFVEELLENFDSLILTDLKEQLAIEEEALAEAEEDKIFAPFKRNRSGGMFGPDYEEPDFITQRRVEETTAAYEEQDAVVKDLAADLDRLTKAFDFKKTFDRVVDSISYVTEHATEMVDYFGSIEFPGADAMIELLEEQITLGEEQLAQLEPTSQAYADLSREILEAEYAAGVLGGTIDANTTSFDDYILGLELASREMTDAEKAICDQINYYRELAMALEEGDPQYQAYMGIIQGLYQDLEDLNAVEEERLRQEWEQKKLMEELSAAGIELRSEQEAQIALYQDLLSRVQEGTYEYNQLIDKMAGLYEVSDLVNMALDDQNQQMVALAVAGIETADAVDAERAGFQALFDCVTAGTHEYDQLIDQMAGFYEVSDIVNMSLDDQNQKMVALAVAGIETEESLQGQIDGYQTLLGSLTAGTHEYAQLIDMLAGFYTVSDIVNMSLDEQNQKMVALSVAGIQTEEAVQAEIAGYQALFDCLTAGTHEYEQLIDTLAGFYDVSDIVNMSLDDQNQRMVAMAVAGVQSEQSVRDQIDGYTALMETFEEGSFEYEQLKDNIEGLYETLGEEAPWAEQERQIEQTKKEIEDLTTEIGELQAQQADIDTQLALDVAPYEAQIGEIQTLFDSLEMGDIGLYEFHQQLEEITGKVQEFGVAWEDTMSSTFGEFDQFEKDMKTAKDAIADMSYFDVDLDTTTADEQIAGLILRMQEYIGTLSPDSDAYTDAQASLNELMTEFEKMGGVIDESTAIQATGDTAVADVQSIIDQFNLEATENKAQIDLDIEKAEKKIAELQEKLDDLQNPISVDFTGGTVAVGEDEFSLDDSSIGLDGVVASDLPISIATRDAESAAQELQTSLESVAAAASETPEIDIGIEPVKQKLSDLSTSFAGEAATVGDEMNELSVKIQDNFDNIDPNTVAYEDAQKSMEALTSKASDMGEALEVSMEPASRAEVIEGDIAAVEHMLEELKQSAETGGPEVDLKIAAAQDELENLHIMLEQEMANIERETTEMASKVQDNLGSIDPNTAALEDAQKAVEELNSKASEMGTALDSGMESTSRVEDIRSDIVAVEQMLDDLKSAAESGSPEVDLEIAAAQNELGNLHIMLEQEMRNIEQQTDEMASKVQDSLSNLDPNTAALEDAQKAVEELNDKASDMGTALDSGMESTSRVEDIQGDIVAVEQMLDDLKSAAESGSPEVDLEIAAAQDELENLHIMLEKETANIERETTEMASKVQDNLGSIDPNTAAIEDAQKAVEELTARTSEMGGAIEDNLSISAQAGEVTNEIMEVQTALEGLASKAETESPEIDMRIQDAQNNIMAIQTEFDGLKDVVEQNDLEIGTDIDTAMRELDEINSILSGIAGTHTVELDVTQVGSLPTIPVATSDKFHTGGILKAHGGMMLGTYQGRREVPFIGLENEMVVRPEVTEMFEPSQWQRFNRSGNPAALGKADRQPSRPIIEVNEATPRTWVRIYDEHLYPAHNNMKKRMVRRRHFER